MARPSSEIRSRSVVTKLAFRPRRLRVRTLDERVAIRFPALLGYLARTVTGLPLRSRVRRYLVARRTCQGFEAVNRGDLDLLLTVYHEDVITRFDAAGGFVPIDLVGEHRGRDGFKRLFENWQAAWENLRVEPRELIDAGDRLIVTVRHHRHRETGRRPRHAPVLRRLHAARRPDQRARDVRRPPHSAYRGCRYARLTRSHSAARQYRPRQVAGVLDRG